MDYCAANKIGKIVVGDCADIHNKPGFSKESNQKIVRSPEQRLKWLIADKFSRIGGTVDTVPEHYSSKTCPDCGRLNEANNRDYRCDCGLSLDRDAVGALNIHNWNAESAYELRDSEVAIPTNSPKGTWVSPEEKQSDGQSLNRRKSDNISFAPCGRSGGLTLPFFGVKYRSRNSLGRSLNEMANRISGFSRKGNEEPAVFQPAE